MTNTTSSMDDALVDEVAMILMTQAAIRGEWDDLQECREDARAVIAAIVPVLEANIVARLVEKAQGITAVGWHGNVKLLEDWIRDAAQSTNPPPGDAAGRE